MTILYSGYMRSNVSVLALPRPGRGRQVAGRGGEERLRCTYSRSSELLSAAYVFSQGKKADSGSGDGDDDDE